MYLDFVKQEQNRKVPRKVNASTPKAVVSFCRDFKKEYGFDVPPLVGAAVLFHSAFVKLALNVEEATIDRPIQFDSNETIIENKPNWNRCVAIIIESIGRIIEATGVRKPEWPLTSETNLSAVLDYLQQDYEKRLNQFFGLILPTKSKLKRPLLYPLAKGGYLLVPADRINERIPT
jgi:hypothetical protein